MAEQNDQLLFTFNHDEADTKVVLHAFLTGHIDRYLKNGVSKYIAHVIKHVNFKLYRANPEGVIWKN